MKTVDRVMNHGVMPAIRISMNNALTSCIAICKELRAEALAETSPSSVKQTLASGQFMLLGLFYPEAISQVVKNFSSQLAKVNITAILQSQALQSNQDPERTPRAKLQAMPKGKAISSRATNLQMTYPCHKNSNHIWSSQKLKSCLELWDFASPLTQRIIPRGLTWSWVSKTPQTRLPPYSTRSGTLGPNIHKMLQQGIKPNNESPSNSGLFSLSPVPSPKGFKKRKGCYRPFSFQYPHVLLVLQNVDSTKGQKFYSPTGALHIPRPVRSFLSHTYPPSLPKVPGLLPRGFAILLPGNSFQHANPITFLGIHWH